MLLRTFVIVLLISFTNAQSSWIGGSNVTDQAGTYNNSLGSLNEIGSRAEMSCWSDHDITWVYGGYGYGNTTTLPGLLSDLWYYNSTSNSWVYVNGSATTDAPGEYLPGNRTEPGGRKNAIRWRTHDQFWLFGGVGYDLEGEEGYLNDFWAYNLTSGVWQFKGGSELADQPPRYNATLPTPPLNTSLPADPGSRGCSFSWVLYDKDGNATLWLWGGETGEEAGYHDDMWKYNVSANAWEWVAGSNKTEGGEGGGKINATGTHPPARACGASWVGADRSLYIYGGYTVNETSNHENVTLLNDIWKFDTTTLQWTNVQPELPPLYNNSINDIPAPRYNPAYTTDRFGNLYIFGGNIPALEEGNDTRNDLWRYSVAEKQWKWILGSALPNSVGEYNATSRNGTPAARAAGCLWIDQLERLWLFGGGTNDERPSGFRNDLWILVENVNPPPPPPPTYSTIGNYTSGTYNTITSGSGAPTSGPPSSTTFGPPTTQGPPSSTTFGPPSTTHGPSTTWNGTTVIPTSGPTSGPTTGGITHGTTGAPNNTITSSHSLTSGHSSATTWHNVTTTGHAPPHSAPTGFIVGSVIGGGLTISAGVVGVLLYRGNLRFRNLFRRRDVEDDAELLPINGSQRTFKH